MRPDSQTALQDAFSDIITGKGVKRSRHELLLEGKQVEEEFIASLEHHGFHITRVGDLALKPGERIPAFFIDQGMAYFGWVFWEKFTETKARKLWGSVVRNAKGDWAIQIPPTKSTPIYANPEMKIEMDVDYPVFL